MKETMMCDAVATTAGACLGSSTATVFVESSTGIAEGGWTGMTAFVTSLLFLASLVIAPVITIIPKAATAPALIFVGVLMMGSVREVDFSDMTAAIPSFVTIVFMPFIFHCQWHRFRAHYLCTDPAFDRPDRENPLSSGNSQSSFCLALCVYGDGMTVLPACLPVVDGIHFVAKNKKQFFGNGGES